MAFDRTDPVDLLALKAEVETDPTGQGYAAVVGQTQPLLELLNAPVSGAWIGKPKISAAAIRSATTYEAYNDLAIDEQEYLRWITGSNGFEEENLDATADLRLQLTGSVTPGVQVAASSWWSNSTRDQMVAAMAAIFDKEASRAETLFGFGTRLSEQDWFAARDYVA